MRYTIFFALIILGLASCIQPPVYPVEPHIEFVSLSTSDIYMDPPAGDTTKSSNTIIHLSFTDGDGDLSHNEQEPAVCDACDGSCYDHPTLNLFIRRKNSNCLASYGFLPFIEEKSKVKAISGDIYVNSPDALYLGPNNNTIIYTIQVKDRAGNFSNIVETTPITVHP